MQEVTSSDEECEEDEEEEEGNDGDDDNEKMYMIGLGILMVTVSAGFIYSHYFSGKKLDNH